MDGYDLSAANASAAGPIRPLEPERLTIVLPKGRLLNQVFVSLPRVLATACATNAMGGS